MYSYLYPVSHTVYCHLQFDFFKLNIIHRMLNKKLKSLENGPHEVKKKTASCSKEDMF